MQNFSNILTPFNGIGLVFSLGENNLLKVEPKGKITDQTRLFIREHKTEIINYLRGDGPEWITPAMCMNPATRGRATRKRPSVVALAWLREHRAALKAAGWTMAELYRANKSKGIAWVTFWDRNFLKVYLHENGVIEFECVDGGRDAIQTARPLKGS